ncbi:OprD family porin [Pseudomonas sp. WS 5407]|uniref:OprD family outer membrane porin n=1 Tax=Pseudomonas sp. WS 5407 TaxID=2717496 RepID=UPI0006D491FF|nr:OprD family outer membrane porin [Pseudomonas sp. WS 5407]KWV69488.1 Porin-like protein NicP precursor [Pseudomonas fluorescens]NMX46714.1 OprD family porin [Pseudomonas sp. WS 5407]
MMNRYLNGKHIQEEGIVDGKEWERESELAYVIQTGTFRDLDVRLRNSSIRRSFGSGSFDENALVINYPLDLL